VLAWLAAGWLPDLHAAGIRTFRARDGCAAQAMSSPSVLLPAADADPYLHYLAGHIHALERTLRAIASGVEILEAIAKPTGLAVRVELVEHLRSLERRVDGLEAVAGELRDRVNKLERTVAVLVHNTGNHEKAIGVLNDQLLDVASEVNRVGQSLGGAE
jgi:hypothetical protein